MTRLLLKLPWFISAPAIVALAAVLAIGANLVLSDYFERSFLDEASPLASAGGSPDGRDGDQPAAATSGAPDAENTQPPTTGTPASAPTRAEPFLSIVAQGTWRDGAPGHNGEGTVQIIRDDIGELVLRVEEFSVTNGPDLFVVLSPSADGYADGSLTLGGLKATDGNFNYVIPAGTDLSQFKSAVVWCRQFDVTFAVATLEDA